MGHGSFLYLFSPHLLKGCFWFPWMCPIRCCSAVRLHEVRSLKAHLNPLPGGSLAWATLHFCPGHKGLSRVEVGYWPAEGEEREGAWSRQTYTLVILRPCKAPQGPLKQRHKLGQLEDMPAVTPVPWLVQCWDDSVP